MVDKIAIVKTGVEGQAREVDEIDQKHSAPQAKLEASGTRDLKLSQARAKILRDASEVFAPRLTVTKRIFGEVESTATHLFLSMTTEKQDFAELTINEGYGLTDQTPRWQIGGSPVGWRRARRGVGVMGALQRNAPLQGPIVMDSPFGRLDESHTSNVVRTLPKMADQVVLLVYEAEVGRQHMRELLGRHLVREYELERVSSRQTNIREVK